VLHLGGDRRGGARAVRDGGSGRDGGAAKGAADRGHGRAEAGGRAAAGIRAGRTAGRAVGHAGRCGPADVCRAGESPRRDPLLLRALSRPLPETGVRLRGLADPAVAAPGAHGPGAPRSATVKRRRTRRHVGPRLAALSVLLLAAAAAVLLSNPRHRAFYFSGSGSGTVVRPSTSAFTVPAPSGLVRASVAPAPVRAVAVTLPGVHVPTPDREG